MHYEMLLSPFRVIPLQRGQGIANTGITADFIKFKK
jgi:hypothetical protein